MGSFRFRRRFKIVPGLRLNLNKKSVSVTGGLRGAHLTRSSRRSNYSVGIPGTGLWFRGNLRKRSGDADTPARAQELPSARQSLDAPPRNEPAAAAVSFTSAEQELRAYWKSRLADGKWTEEDEAALNVKLEQLAIDPAELGVDQPLLAPRFADLALQSKIAMPAAGRLPAIDSPALMAKKGEVVHFECVGNLMKRRSFEGATLFDLDDEGVASVTSRRVVFVGERRTLDTSYGRLNGLTFWDDGEAIGETIVHSFLVIHDSQKTSCLYLGPGNADLAAAAIRQAAAST